MCKQYQQHKLKRLNLLVLFVQYRVQFSSNDIYFFHICDWNTLETEIPVMTDMWSCDSN